MIDKKDIIIASNRLPVTVVLDGHNLIYKISSGGLAGGLKSFLEYGAKWIGWPGIASDLLSESQINEITITLKKMGCIPVFLTKKQIELYYNGYCNRVIWPLFHGFGIYEQNRNIIKRYWDSYRRVNELFADAIKTWFSDSKYI